MNRLVVTVEARFYQTPDNIIWTENHFASDFWDRYLQVFDLVRVVARVKNVTHQNESWKKVEKEKVEVYPLPYYIGPLGYIKKYCHLKSKLSKCVELTDKVLMRVGSPIADLLQPILMKRKIPYAVEVVGDPWDVFGPGVFNHPLRPILRIYFTYKLKKQCQSAIAGSYVTQEILQKKYPLKEGALSIGASTIKLLESDLASSPKILENGKKDFIIVNIGSLEYMVKGTDVLIKSIHYLKKHSPAKYFKLKILGEGRCQQQLEILVDELDLKNQVEFIGSLSSGKAVQQFLDSGDLFILPSRSEGLPRAMIEAMSRGLFCLGADVGGIKELIPQEQRARVGDADHLGELIEYFSDNIDQLNIGAHNAHERSKDYLHNKLDSRRLRFYKHLSQV